MLQGAWFLACAERVCDEGVCTAAQSPQSTADQISLRSSDLRGVRAWLKKRSFLLLLASEAHGRALLFAVRCVALELRAEGNRVPPPKLPANPAAPKRGCSALVAGVHLPGQLFSAGHDGVFTGAPATSAT